MWRKQCANHHGGGGGESYSSGSSRKINIHPNLQVQRTEKLPIYPENWVSIRAVVWTIGHPKNYRSIKQKVCFQDTQVLPDIGLNITWSTLSLDNATWYLKPLVIFKWPWPFQNLDRDQEIGCHSLTAAILTSLITNSGNPFKSNCLTDDTS